MYLHPPPLPHHVGAGITAAAGTRVALQFILVKILQIQDLVPHQMSPFFAISGVCSLNCGPVSGPQTSQVVCFGSHPSGPSPLWATTPLAPHTHGPSPHHSGPPTPLGPHYLVFYPSGPPFFWPPTPAGSPSSSAVACNPFSSMTREKM